MSLLDWTPFGPDAWLLRFAEGLGEETFRRGQALVSALERHPPEGLIEFVPSFTTILLEFRPGALGPDPRSRLATLGRRLEAAAGSTGATAGGIGPGPLVEIPVLYDGPDLARVAESAGLSVDEVIARHSGVIYHVYLIGFSPGFPYLGELDPKLRTPRLAAPRPRVPAGSVAIGGEHTGIYSVESPGGWNIVGRTPTRLFVPEAAMDAAAGGSGVSGGNGGGRPVEVDRDGGRDPERRCFRLRAGDRVRFVPLARWPGEGAS